jgi:hypothetical protein
MAIQRQAETFAYRDGGQWRLAMAWEDWAPHIEELESAGCNKGQCHYHTPNTATYVIDHKPGVSILRYQHNLVHDRPNLDIVAIATHENHQRDGVAESFMRRLHQDHPGIPISPGTMTPQGKALHDGLLNRIPEANEVLSQDSSHLINASRKIFSNEATGDCYQAAAQHLMKETIFAGNPNSDLRLVHGEVSGQGPLKGRTFGHAWIENGDSVIDRSNGQNIQMPKDAYYLLGKISNYHVYTPEEARDKMMEHGHYGPWDLQGKHPNWIEPQWADNEDDEDDDEDLFWDDEDEDDFK